MRRHPHVFGDESASTPEEVIKNWEAIKAQEKAAEAEEPDAGTAIVARRHSEQTAGASRSPPDFGAGGSRRVSTGRMSKAYSTKLQEEVREVERGHFFGRREDRRERLEDEIGDMLFVIVNIARHLKIDSESALKRANRKFKSVFSSWKANSRGRARAWTQHHLPKWNCYGRRQNCNNEGKEHKRHKKHKRSCPSCAFCASCVPFP